MTVHEVKKTLLERKGNLRCQEVVDLLSSLGFVVRDGQRGGHKVFVHDGLKDFFSGSFNCGHGKNPKVAPAYITQILRVIEMHEHALQGYLGEEHER